jgi:glyoxylase-like metal-dependent hydrolase (beta-lactamase superfamily II)
MGEDAKKMLADRVYPANPEGTVAEFPKVNKCTFIAFDDTSSTEHLKTVSPLGTFARGVDFFGDGSVYLVDTPGHCPGHISCLARVAEDTFVFLAGDLCHIREAYDPGARLISSKIYEDIEVARDTVRRLVDLNKKIANAVIILAHEAPRLQEGMGLFPEDVREWAMDIVRKRKQSGTVL